MSHQFNGHTVCDHCGKCTAACSCPGGVGCTGECMYCTDLRFTALMAHESPGPLPFRKLTDEELKSPTWKMDELVLYEKIDLNEEDK